MEVAYGVFGSAWIFSQKDNVPTAPIPKEAAANATNELDWPFHLVFCCCWDEAFDANALVVVFWTFEIIDCIVYVVMKI